MARQKEIYVKENHPMPFGFGTPPDVPIKNRHHGQTLNRRTTTRGESPKIPLKRTTPAKTSTTIGEPPNATDSQRQTLKTIYKRNEKTDKYAHRNPSPCNQL